jgi:hypothetical protein
VRIADDATAVTGRLVLGLKMVFGDIIPPPRPRAGEAFRDRLFGEHHGEARDVGQLLERNRLGGWLKVRERLNA